MYWKFVVNEIGFKFKKQSDKNNVTPPLIGKAASGSQWFMRIC